MKRVSVPAVSGKPLPGPCARLVRELHRVSADGMMTVRAMQRQPLRDAPRESGLTLELSDATVMLLRLVAIHDDRTPADWIAQAVSARAEAIGIGRLADEIERHGGDLAGCDLARHADSGRENPARGKR